MGQPCPPQTLRILESVAGGLQVEKQLSLQAGLTAECSLLWSPFQHGGLRGDLVNGCSNLERILPNLRWYYQGVFWECWRKLLLM